MKFASIVGARPQFIKLAPVSRALRRRHSEVIIHTGQHYHAQLSATIFDELTVPSPDYNLDIGSGAHGEQTGKMLAAIEDVLIKERPDGVIVFGDTNSTLAAALAAVKLHIPVAHVEAGLRSFDRRMPEEINRVVTDHVSARLFCPTALAQRNASAEGIVQGVEVVGDVMYDILLQVEPSLAERSRTLLPALGIQPQEFVLATIHRAANTDDAVTMRRIAQALGSLDMPVVFPVHPRTRNRLDQYGITWGERVIQVEPVGYLDMLALQRAARCIVTDSGGIQKEAFLLGVPCVTVRDTTEWPETLEGGWNMLTGSNTEAIREAVHRPWPALPPGKPFGEGDAAERISQSLLDWPNMLSYGCA